MAVAAASAAAAVATSRASLPVPSRNLLRFMRRQTGMSLTPVASAGPQRSCRQFSAAPCPPRKPLSTPYRSRTSDSLSRRRPASLSPRCLWTTGAVQKARDPDPSERDRAESASWQEKLWGNTANKGSKPLHPDDLPSEGLGNSSFVFQNRRNLAAKASLDPRLRCTEVDEHGNVILVDGEFKKTELIAKVSRATSSA